MRFGLSTKFCVLTSVRSILFCRSATSRAMSSSDSLSPRSSSCQTTTTLFNTPSDRHKHIRRADGGESYRSSTFFSFLLLQLLDGLQQASVVGDAVHSGVLLVLFRVHIPQQLDNVDVLVLLWTLLLRRRPEKKSLEIRSD